MTTFKDKDRKEAVRQTARRSCTTMIEDERRKKDKEKKVRQRERDPRELQGKTKVRIVIHRAPGDQTLSCKSVITCQNHQTRRQAED